MAVVTQFGIDKKESKYKIDEQGELVPPACPVCKQLEEPLEDYNNGCTKIIEFRNKLAQHLHTADNRP